MTVIYGETTYHLTDDLVTIQAEDGERAPVAPETLPLPVARVLAAFRARVR